MSARESRFMLTEFLPVQIALKTLAPIIFGGTGPYKLMSDRTLTAFKFCWKRALEALAGLCSPHCHIAFASTGLVQGALASAATETLAATSNFIIGRSFLTDSSGGFPQNTKLLKASALEKHRTGFGVFLSSAASRWARQGCWNAEPSFTNPSRGLVVPLLGTGG